MTLWPRFWPTLYVKKFTGFCQVLKRRAQKKIGSFFSASRCRSPLQACQRMSTHARVRKPARQLRQAACSAGPSLFSLQIKVFASLTGCIFLSPGTNQLRQLEHSKFRSRSTIFWFVVTGPIGHGRLGLVGNPALRSAEPCKNCWTDRDAV